MTTHNVRVGVPESDKILDLTRRWSSCECTRGKTCCEDSGSERLTKHFAGWPTHNRRPASSFYVTPLLYMPCAPYSSLGQHILREARTTHHLIAMINVNTSDGNPQNTREIEHKFADCLMESLPSTSTAIL